MRGDFDEDEIDDVDDPTEYCSYCGCHLFTEEHELDCWYYGDPDDDDED